MGNPKVVILFEPPRKTGFRGEGAEGFPFARLVNEIELLKADFLATQRGGPPGGVTAVTPASLTLEYDPATETVSRAATGLFPPYLAVHALAMLLLDTVGRQQQMMMTEMARRQQGSVQIATPDMVPPNGPRLIH